MRKIQKFQFEQSICGRRELRLAVCLCLCLLFLVSSGGCLRRRMTINSNPQGATVYVDGHQIGKTPVSTDFTYYGTRNIRLEMDNYQTLSVKQKVRPPWYEYPPFDFFTETFSASEIKDHHVWTYDLQQRAISSDDQIMQRANEFAFEGSRTINPDGTLGAPVSAEEYMNRSRVGENPDAGFVPSNSGSGAISSAGPTEALAPPAEDSYPAAAPLNPQSPAPPQTAPLAPGVPNAEAGVNPNSFPTGSADWDTPNRYPQSGSY